ncbi:MAG TPA: D-glycerate dehydrogenase [Gaiellaceae bacterium]|nr:D-glycerate dehydrogenase [Gaiellaceae bacterium]
MAAASPPPRVYVSRRVPERVRAELERSFAAVFHESEWPPAREELLAGVRGADGIVAMLTERVDDELLDAAGPQLRIVANFAVGYDNVDVDACARRGVIVSNTPDVLAEATAELTIALLLSLARRVTEGDRFLRRREPWSWAPTFMLGSSLRGRLLGVVGLGRIGAEVARLARALGMEVVYSGRSGPKPGVPYEHLPLEELLRRADVVTLHCRLTPETRHLIGAEQLRAMRRDAFLVNTARGPVVDEAALVEALREGEIAGAALDVFEREPEVHPGLLTLETVVLAPHLGSATRETREAMGMLCVEALRAVLLEGRRPANAVTAEEKAA